MDLIGAFLVFVTCRLHCVKSVKLCESAESVFLGLFDVITTCGTAAYWDLLQTANITQDHVCWGLNSHCFSSCRDRLINLKMYGFTPL